MIGKSHKHSSFWDTLEYVLSKESATLVSTNMMDTQFASLASEFRACAAKSKTERVCAHIILSLPEASDKQDLDDGQYTALAKRYLQEMGFIGEGTNNSQYAIARHRDVNNEHLHIIANRVQLDGTTVNDSWDYYKNQVVIRGLEQEFGLAVTPCSNKQIALAVKEEHGIDTGYTTRRAPTIKQKHHKSGTSPLTQIIGDAIDDAIASSNTVSELVTFLHARSIKVLPKYSDTRFANGFSYEKDGWKIPGYRIGSAYTFPGLLKRGLSYDEERDSVVLQKAVSDSKVPELILDLPELQVIPAEPNINSTTRHKNNTTLSTMGVEQLRKSAKKKNKSEPNLSNVDQLSADAASESNDSPETDKPVNAYFQAIDVRVQQSLKAYRSSLAESREQAKVKSDQVLAVALDDSATVAISSEQNQEQDNIATPLLKSDPLVSVELVAPIIVSCLERLGVNEFRGNTYRAAFDGNTLVLHRNSDDDCLFKANYLQTHWEEIENRLILTDVEQFQHLLKTLEQTNSIYNGSVKVTQNFPQIDLSSKLER